MEPNKILSASLLDIVFDGRNKEYGAYDLRKSYNKRITIALLVTAALLVAIFAAAFVASNIKPSDSGEIVEIKEVVMEDLKQEEPEEEPIVEPPPPPPAAIIEPPKVEMKQFTTPKIVEDEKVKEPPPAQEELVDVKIGNINQEGIKDIGIVAPTVKGVDGGTGVVEVPKPKVEDENQIFTKVEKEAVFPGGDKAWKRFLDRNLRPEVPIDKGAPAGRYQVVIQFVVSKDGSVSDMKALTNHGFGMEDEAMRALKKAPKWEPAVQNGRQVNAYKKQPITFVVTNE